MKTEHSAPWLVTIMGPTASGKTSVAEALADDLNADLINADAFQMYRGLSIGTGKPDFPARYHLMDNLDPNQEYGVGEYVREAAEILTDLHSRGKNAILVGGTGLYIRALTERYADMATDPDPTLREQINSELATNGLPWLVEKLRSLSPETASKIDVQNPVRVTRAIERILSPGDRIEVSYPDFRQLKVGIVPLPEFSEANIKTRVRQMMQNGWVTEVKELLSLGFGSSDPGFRAIGYRTISDHLQGALSLEECESQIVQETIRYAKRQRTWLRKEPSLTSVETPDEALATVRARVIPFE